MPMRISSNEPVNRNFTDIPMPQIVKRALAVQNCDVLLSALQPKNFITQIFEQLKSCWNWIFSRFSSPATTVASEPETSSYSVEEKLNFGTAFIQDCLADPAVQPYLDSSCRVAIVAKLNQQIVSQHLTVMVRPALAISRQLAIDLLQTNLGIYAQDHPVRSSDELKMEAYFLKPNGAVCDVEYIYRAQSSGNGHDHCPGLSRVNATQYLSSKYNNGGPQRDRFLQFLCFNL